VTRTACLCLVAAALLLTGCARDQAQAAANIRILAIATAKAGPVTEEQLLLLQGILCEADAIRESTEPEAQPTVDSTAAPATMAAQAREHAGTVRTIGAQVADSTWTWVLGAITAAGTLLLGGGVGGLLAKRGAGSLLRTAVEFGSAALDALKKSNPPVAAEVVAEQVARQEALGHREAIRAAVATVDRAGEAVQPVAESQALADAQDRAARAESAGHQATAELRRLWAENVQLREAQASALERKPKAKRTKAT
jgi:hypothetical protein